MRARLATAAVVLAALGIGSGLALAEPPRNHRPEGGIPSEGSPLPVPLQDACGVAVDATGKIFVASYYGHAIYVFSPRRDLEMKIEVPQPPQPLAGKAAGGPCDLAIDSAGNLYVNRWHYDVLRFAAPAPGGAYTTASVIDSHRPTSVTVDAAGHVFVDDRTYVAEYDSSGAPLLNGKGEAVRIGLGSLGDGYGVAVSGFEGSPGFASTAGDVYVADAADETVKVYDPLDPSAAPRTIDGDGTPQLGFNHLADSDVAVDPVDGHVYVVDNLQPGSDEPEAVVDEFSSLGHYRGPVPPEVASGSPSGVIDGAPTALAISEHDIFVTSGNYFDDNDEPSHPNSKVLVFGPPAKVETQILEVTKTGAGSGTVFSGSPAGLGCGTACEGEFTLGTTVVLNAVPGLHSRFAGWSGCAPLSTPAQCRVTIGEAREKVSAEFEPIPQAQLAVVRSGSGSGMVSSDPAGIDCGAVCAAEFDLGPESEVTLTATPGPHSAFAGWHGCDSEPGPGECTVTIDGARSASAGFEAVAGPPVPPPPAPGQQILSVYSAVTGTATGTVTSEPAGIECGGTCVRAFGQGTTVTLVASPAPGSSFLDWGGCDVAVGERCTVTLGTDRSVVGAFGAGSPGALRLGGLAVHGDSATLQVTVPAAGTLSASGPGLRPASALPLAARRVALPLRLNAAGRRSLGKSRSNSLAVEVALAFSPFDGPAAVRAGRTVVFRRPEGQR